MTDKPPRVSEGVFKNPAGKKSCKHNFVSRTKKVGNGYIVNHFCKTCGYVPMNQEYNRFKNALDREIKKS